MALLPFGLPTFHLILLKQINVSGGRGLPTNKVTKRLQVNTYLKCKTYSQMYEQTQRKKGLSIQDMTYILSIHFRKLILFLVSIGLFFLFLGGILLVIYLLYQQENKQIRPMIVIGKTSSIVVDW